MNDSSSLFMSNQELEYRALKILEQQPDLTQRQLAEELGVSLGKTHYLVKSLIDVGWVKLDNFQKSDNKWGYAYLLTPMGIAEKAAITARFLVRKRREYNALIQSGSMLRATWSPMKPEQRLLKRRSSLLSPVVLRLRSVCQTPLWCQSLAMLLDR